MRRDPAPPAGSRRRVAARRRPPVTPRWVTGPSVEPDPATTYPAAVLRRRAAPTSSARGVRSSRRIHPPLWPLFTDWKTPVLSVRRLARRAARRHRRGQGVVVAFDGRPDVHLTVTVNGLEAVRMLGRRDRPWFVALDQRPWTVRATAGPLGADGRRARCEVAVPAPRARQVDLVRFRLDGAALACDVTTVRAGDAPADPR